MLTPTFLAGFCTVLASILAYGTTQTHLLYSGGLPPACAEASCTSVGPHPGNGGTLGKASPEDHSNHDARGSQPQPVPQQPATGGGGGAGGGGGQPGQAPRTHDGHPAVPRQQAGGPGGNSPGPRVRVVYRTQRRSSGQFIAAVTITNRGRTVLAGWQLQMNYRRATISRMWGARWLPSGPRSRDGLAAAPATQRPLRPGMTVRFVFLARGAAGPPGGCAINGYQCTFQSRSPGKPHRPHDPGSHQGHAHNPGTSRAHKPGSSQAGSPGSVSLQLTASVRTAAAGTGQPGTQGRTHAAGQAQARRHSHARWHSHTGRHHHHHHRKASRYRLL
jgi:Cellulose binding domain